MTERLDVVGIGNAMVDAVIPSNKNGSSFNTSVMCSLIVFMLKI